ncbi:glycosyl hydrolase family 28 protein [Dyadobacter crusticola]|uniref:glycosyl hydrolase family 28 protein n=1 Tax=Dyadobacter crusticola TaxID=292407 RepID=UPI0004E13152|nr:glycosyl hydrolase family 28 protein [Dyadobacter crusticola]
MIVTINIEMTIYKAQILIIASILVLFTRFVQSQSIVTYITPAEIKKSDRYEILVRVPGDTNWQQVEVQTAKVNVRNLSKSGRCAFANFDASFSRGIDIKVQTKSAIMQNVVVRPRNEGITFIKGRNFIQFTIHKAQKLSIELDNDRLNNLFIFANDLESNIPDKNDPNIIYLGPGVHKAENIKIKNGQTIYLNGGALVQGSINVYNKKDLTIRGRGILNGEILNHDRSKTRPNLLKFKNGKNITIDGITLIDSPVWSLFIDNCEQVNIRNVKIFGHMINADGITLSQSKNINIADCFIRSADDNISIKSLNGNPTLDILIKNSTLWADDAHNMLIGPESKGATYRNIRFKNIAVLENTQKVGMYSGVMSIMASDKANVSDVHWDDISIEDITAGEIIRLNYTKVHSVDKDDYGSDIRDIYFSNIQYNGTSATPGTIKGVDGARTIRNVSIRNFKFNKDPVQVGTASNNTRSRALKSTSVRTPAISVNKFVERMTIIE